MIPERKIREFVRQLESAAGANLQSVVLYGSAAADDFDPEFSDVNLLCLVRDSSFDSLRKLAPAVRNWRKARQPAPLMMTLHEMQRSADVFAIEFLDMKRHYRILSGEDLLAGLPVPLHQHPGQLEYELREKVLLLRSRLLSLGSDDRAMWELMLHSLSGVLTLFRHALLASGVTVPDNKKEVVEALARRTAFDSSAVLSLIEVRAHRRQRREFDPAILFSGYLAALERVTAAVDEHLGPWGHAPA